MTYGEYRDYVEKVFQFSELLESVGDGRRRPRHPMPKALSALIHGMTFRRSSLHAIEESARRGPLFSPDWFPQRGHPGPMRGGGLALGPLWRPGRRGAEGQAQRDDQGSPVGWKDRGRR